MSLRLTVESDELLRFIRRLDRIEPRMGDAIADALNEVGDNTVREAATALSAETGLNISAVQRYFIVTRATRSRKEYTIRIQSELIEEERVGRGLPGRPWEGRSQQLFEQELLVNVVTAEDDAVCPICKQISEEGPYDPRELGSLKAAHPHFLNPTLGCRCATVPFQPRGRMSMRARSGRGSTVNTRLTLSQLANRVRQNVRTVLRAR